MTEPIDSILRAYDTAAPLASAATIPASWYADPRIADLERRAVFGGTWQVVGRLNQVSEPGEYITADIAGEPIMVVRGRDGVLRGFFNVCRHHAAAVMTERCGEAERLRCPYHGWTYALDGKLMATPELPGIAGFRPDNNGLVPASAPPRE